MPEYPTDEMVDAAMDVMTANDWREHPDDYELFRADLRAALIAADRAAWRPINEAPTDGTNVLLIGQYNIHHVEHRFAALDNYSGAPTHFRPLPLPPITSVDSTPEMARIVAAEVPASPADVLPSGDAG